MPEYQDEVVHVSGEASGTVIATYEINGIHYLDVREDDHIRYKTLDVKWETTKAVDE